MADGLPVVADVVAVAGVADVVAVAGVLADAHVLFKSRRSKIFRNKRIFIRLLNLIITLDEMSEINQARPHHTNTYHTQNNT